MKTILAAIAALAAVPILGAHAAPPPTSIDWAKGTPIMVTLTNRGFVPRRIVMRQGGRYILRLRNPSDRGHTFQAKDFFAQARVSPRDQGLVPRNEVELKPGRSATLHLIAPTTPGAIYYVKSSRVADAASDFKGEIVVR